MKKVLITLAVGASLLLAACTVPDKSYSDTGSGGVSSELDELLDSEPALLRQYCNALDRMRELGLSDDAIFGTLVKQGSFDSFPSGTGSDRNIFAAFNARC